jgi:hypothetical protein
MTRNLRLWWLRRQQKKSDKKYAKYVSEAEGEEKESRIAQAMDVRDQAREEILSLRSILLSDKAESLGIPIPPLSDKESWEEGLTPRAVHLTLNAQAKLLHSIREEQREKWSVTAFVLREILTPIIGLIGAIMGLLSLIHVFRPK